MADTIGALQKFLRETSRQRLMSHCRNLKVTIAPWDGKALSSSSDSLGERTSSIMLWGGLGKITLKAHFTLPTAATWAARGLCRLKEEVQDYLAIDFFREFSNLHAGYLRGVFESQNMLFGASLPFVMPGEDMVYATQARDPGVILTFWELSDGENKIVYSCEIELTDLAPFEKAKDHFQSLIDSFQVEPIGDGLVEFLVD